MPNITICRPNWSQVEIREIYCTTCQCNRWMRCLFQDWYGWYLLCFYCGDQWGDGERLQRPFARGWRKKETERAAQWWSNYLNNYPVEPEPLPEEHI
jgi:hypothetical protein